MDLRKIIVFGPPKEASLYFDEVFPIDFGENLYTNNHHSDDSSLYIPFIDHRFDENVIRSLAPKETSSDSYKRLVDISMVFTIVNHLRSENGIEDFWKVEKIDYISDYIVQNTKYDVKNIAKDIEKSIFDEREFFLSLAKDFQATAIDAGFDNCPTWFSDKKSNIEKPFEMGGEKLFLSLSALNLVDPKKISWGHIVEFRKDEKSRQALRNLRIFFQNEYGDRNLHYIEDDLAKRIFEYDEAAKIWGFERIQRSLSVIFTERSIIASSAGSIAALAAGGGLLSVAGAGAAISLGGAILEFGKIAIDRKKETLDRPVQYLIDLRDKLK